VAVSVDAKERSIARKFVTGRIRFAEFAITNVCIAKCSFCEIWKQRPKSFSDREKSLQVIENLARMGVGHITLTGGEPLLHPNIVDFVRRCTERNVHTSVLDAAPSLVTDEKLELLTEAGCNMISISFDSDDPKVLEESRKIPGIMRDMEVAVGKLRDTPIKSMASILIWNNNHDRMDKLFDRATEMGFDLISVNYPTFSKSVVYPLGGEGISLSRGSVIESLKSVIELKKSRKYKIINSVTSMENIVRYLQDPSTVRYQCLGGYRVMFVDREFDVRPCMQLPNVLGNMLTMTEKDLEKVPCNSCNMSWYRDFSDLTSGVRSLPLYWEALKTGRSML
jgi:MoaA/NifB/PqqE/SkfB family radical SAM enzyme